MIKPCLFPVPAPGSAGSFVIWMDTTYNHMAKELCCLSSSPLSYSDFSFILDYFPLKVEWKWCLLNVYSPYLNYPIQKTFSFQQCRRLIKLLCLPKRTERCERHRAQRVFLCHKVMAQFTQCFQLSKLVVFDPTLVFWHPLFYIQNSDG